MRIRAPAPQLSAVLDGLRVRISKGRIWKALGTRQDPPSPDLGVAPSYVGRAIVEVTYSPRHTHRAVVTKDDRDRYRVHVERWDTSEWGAQGLAYWCGAAGVKAHDLDSARAWAVETLGEIAAEEAV